MYPTPDSTSANLQQTIADLQRRLAEARAERDESEAQKTAPYLAFVSRNRAESMARQWLAGVPFSNSNEQSVLARSTADDD